MRTFRWAWRGRHGAQIPPVKVTVKTSKRILKHVANFIAHFNSYFISRLKHQIRKETSFAALMHPKPRKEKIALSSIRVSTTILAHNSCIKSPSSQRIRVKRIVP
jgi:hypothetical protein